MFVLVNGYLNTELIKYNQNEIFADNNSLNGENIKDLITKDLENCNSDLDGNSRYKKRKYQGENYYHGRNDILQRTLEYTINGITKIDYNRSNYRIPHNFHKIIVDQTCNYLVGKPIKFSSKNNNKVLIDKILETVTENFDKTMIDLVKKVSNEADAWLHSYIDKKGNFKYMIVSSKEIIPIYDTKTQTQLQFLIRYYDIKVIDSNKKEKKRWKVEVWDSEKVTYYVQDENNNYLFDNNEPINPSYHFYNVDGAGQIEANSWGKIPFVQFRNNAELMTSLEQYKQLIDAYDVCRSDFANNLADIQDVIWVLENYGGESLSEFLMNLKVKKAICVQDGGSANPISFEVPYKAREVMLESLKKDIFQIGMAVDITSDSFTNVSSGEALKRLYALLDLKCDTIEIEFTSSIKEFLYFVFKYLNITENLIVKNTSDIIVTFNRNVMSNTAEIIENCVNSVGILSDETIRENHPFVKDTETEKERIEKEKMAKKRTEKEKNNKSSENSGFKQTDVNSYEKRETI